MADTLEEALGSLESSNDHGSDSRILFSIDNDLRTITVPPGTVFGVYFDRNVQTINFEMPRYYHDVDLSAFSIRINYIANGIGDIYLVSDKTVEDEKIKFSWTVDLPAYMKNGDNVIFSVCLRDVDITGVVVREFNTTICQVSVLQGLEVEVSPADIPQVRDYLLQIANMASSVEEASENVEDIYEHVEEIYDDMDSIYNAFFDILAVRKSGWSPLTVDSACNSYAKDLKAEFLTPEQDLHGFSNPWIGGDGKNLLDPSTKEAESVTTRTWYYDDGYTCDAGTTYTFSGFPTVAHPTTVSIKDKSTGDVIAQGTNVVTNTFSADTLVYFEAVETTGNVDATEYQLEVGSSQTSYEPYENICDYYPHGADCLYPNGKAQLTNNGTYVATVPFQEPVYGGSVDFDTGVVAPSKRLFCPDETVTPLSYRVIFNSAYVYYSAEQIGEAFSGVDGSNCYKLWNGGGMTTGNIIFKTTLDDVPVIAITDRTKGDYTVEQWKEWVADVGLQILYTPAEQPATIQATPAKLKLVEGTNVISALRNTTRISLRYIPSDAGYATTAEVQAVADDVSSLEERVEDLETQMGDVASVLATVVSV